MQSSLELINSFHSALKKQGKKESTVQSYTRDVRQFLEFLECNNESLENVSSKTLLSFRRILQRKKHGGKINSFRRATIAIRQFFRLLPKLSDLKISPLDSLPIPSRVENPPPKLKASDIELLLKATKKINDLKGGRDQSILSLLSYEGLKVNELLSLEWSHLILNSQKSSLLIPGERKRVIDLNKKTAKALRNYKMKLEENKSILPTKYKMFLSFKGKSRNIILPQISRHGLKFLIYELGNSCNFSHLNTEALRHHAIQFQLECGKKTEDVMKHLGLKRPGNITKHQV